jgi:hypothetical protein
MICCVRGDFLCRLAGFSEHGIFHGIINQPENKSLNIKVKKGLFIIEWE